MKFTSKPATEADFWRRFGEILAILNSDWLPESVNIRGLSTWPDICRYEAEANRLWLEARRTRKFDEIFALFDAAVTAWKAALLDGVTSTEFYK